MDWSLWPYEKQAKWPSRLKTAIWLWWIGETGTMTRRHQLAEYLLVALLAALPLGTRLIVAPGAAAGHAVEWGTWSLFGTQLLALAFIVMTFSARPRRPKLAMALALPLAVAIVLATVASAHPEEAAATAWWLLLGLVAWVAVIALRPSVKLCLGALIASGCLQAALGVWQFAVQNVRPEKWLGMAAHVPAVAGVSVLESADGRWLRAYGTMAHPNVYGIFVAVALVAAVHFAMAERAGVHRWRLHLAVGLLSMGLLASYSRSAWLAAFVGLVILTVAHSLFGRGWHHATTACLTVAAVFFVGTVAEPELMMGRLAAVGRLERQSIEQRVDSFTDGQTLLSDSPLVGTGPGLAVRRLSERDTARPWWQLEPPHFLPLAVAAEVGLVGLVTWLFLIGVIIRHLAVKARSPESFVLIAIIFSMGAAAFFDHYFWTSWPGYLLFWLMLGLGVVAANPPEHEDKM